MIISQLRTEHIRCNKYLFKIGKHITPACDCDDESTQDVYHILTKCKHNDDVRKEAEDKMGVGVCIAGVLYVQEGVEWGVKLWRQFVNKSRERKWEQEEEQRKDEVKLIGYGGLES